MVERGEVRAADAQKAQQLGSEVQRAIVAKGMRPVVRSVYSRRAFQSSTTNDVRAPSPQSGTPLRPALPCSNVFTHHR